MKTTSGTPGAPRPRSRAPVLCVALFVLALVAPAVHAAPSFVSSPPPAAVLISRSLWTPIEWAMGNQRRMLQVATVGMCLALYIIMWRK